jgi:hypothetical protein
MNPTEIRYNWSRISPDIAGRMADNIYGMTPAYRRVLVSRSEPPNVKAKDAISYLYGGARHRGGCLVLCGTRGTGKTLMALELAVEAMAREAVTYAAYFRMSTIVRSVFSAGRGTQDPQSLDDFTRATNCGLLILDEIHEERLGEESSMAHRLLTELVDVRCGHDRATYLVANMDPQQLQAALPSASDRLRQRGRWLHLDYPSMRGGFVGEAPATWARVGSEPRIGESGRFHGGKSENGL